MNNTIVCVIFCLAICFSQAMELDDIFNRLCGKENPDLLFTCFVKNNILEALIERNTPDIFSMYPTCTENKISPEDSEDAVKFFNKICHELSDKDKQELVNCYKPFFNEYLKPNAKVMKIIETCLSK